MNQVERAIILAAGKGERLRPATLRTPKPLVKVNGVRMIDSVINALHQNGITEIYIVIGYLKEQFLSLPEEYPGVQLIENPLYDSWNNIASLYAARDHLCNCMILDGDQIIHRPEILHRGYERSGYNVIWTNKPTNEWILEVKKGIVTGCSRNGGSEGWQLFSVSRWNKEDSIQLKKDLEEEFNNKNKTIYWDDIALFCYPEHYKLGIYKMPEGSITEIDGYEELKAVDKSYK